MLVKSLRPSQHIIDVANALTILYVACCFTTNRRRWFGQDLVIIGLADEKEEAFARGS